MAPTLANGKICYIEMPATDIARSADLYKKVFGWQNRKRGDGSTAFDDSVGEVSGTWVLGRPPSAKPGLLFQPRRVTTRISRVAGRGRLRLRPRSRRDSAIREET